MSSSPSQLLRAAQRGQSPTEEMFLCFFQPLRRHSLLLKLRRGTRATRDSPSYMTLNNDFNGSNERTRRATRHNSESRERGGGSIYVETEIKGASGSYSFRRLETVWGVSKVQNSNRPFWRRIVSAGFPSEGTECLIRV